MNPDVVGVLTEAFDRDPVFRLLFPDDRDRALREWFSTVVEAVGGCRWGEVRGVGSAAAVWTTDSCPSCLEHLDDALTAVVLSRTGARGIDLSARVRAAAAPVEVRAWSLHWLGVAPHAQGRGYGGRLLADVLAAAHATGTALCTTTPNPAAVPFYARHGLVPLAERAVEGATNLRLWTLLAPAATQPRP